MRRILYAVLILFISQYVAGQSGRFGVKGGLNAFVLASSNDTKKDFSEARVGFTLGGTYEIVLNKSFSIQSELNYSHQEAGGGYYGETIKLGYTQVPVLFRYRTNDQKTAFYAGPQLGFLGKATLRAENGDESGVLDQFNRTDFGIAFGIARIPVNKGITVDLRIYQGMMNVIKSEFDGGARTRPSLLALTVGYIFGK